MVGRCLCQGEQNCSPGSTNSNDCICIEYNRRLDTEHTCRHFFLDIAIAVSTCWTQTVPIFSTKMRSPRLLHAIKTFE